MLSGSIYLFIYLFGDHLSLTAEKGHAAYQMSTHTLCFTENVFKI